MERNGGAVEGDGIPMEGDGIPMERDGIPMEGDGIPMEGDGSAVEAIMMNVVTVENAKLKRGPYWRDIRERRVKVRVVVI